jgi:hypothetical protein
VNIKVVDVAGQPFKQAVSIQTATKPENFWNAQTIHDTARPVPAGADVTIRMMARSADKDVPAKVNVTWKEQSTNTQLHDQQFTVGNTWTPIEMKFKNPRLVHAKIELNVGWQAQTLEVANLGAEYSGGNITEIETMQRAEEAKSAAGPRSTMTIAPGSYYDKLRQEFKGVGDAYFVLGSNEDEALDSFSGVNDNKGANIGAIQKFEVQGQPFKRAMRLKVDNEKSTGMWDVHVNANNKAPVYKGEQLLWVFWARGVKAPQKVDDGAGAVIGPLMWQRDPYDHVSWPWPSMDITPEWKRYWVVSEANAGTGGAGGVARDYAPHKLDFNFNVGHKNQTIELGGIAVMAFKNADVSKLPQQNWDYFGRDPKAPWRAEANKRIDPVPQRELASTRARCARQAGAQCQCSHRDEEARLFVRNRNIGEIAGRPEQHAVPRRGEQILQLRRLLQRLQMGGDGRRLGLRCPTRKAALEWLKANGKTVRGHVLVWPSFHNSPNRLKELKDKPKELQAEILKHVTDTITTYKDYVSDWDVTNETEGNADFMNIIGPQAMIEWYKAARAADPKAKLTFLEPASATTAWKAALSPLTSCPTKAGLNIY